MFSSMGAAWVAVSFGVLFPCGLVAGSLATTAPPTDSWRILDPAGRPVEAALVRVLTPPAAGPAGALGTLALDVRSDALGRVKGEVPRLERLLLIIDHPGHAPWLREMGDGPGPLRDVQLEPGFWGEGRVTLEGRAAGSAGAPVPSGRVCARWQVEPAGWRRRVAFERCAALGPEGRWSLTGLGAEAVTLTAEAAGYLPASRSWRPISPAAPAPELVLTPGVQVTGQVRDPLGRPVAGARLSAPGAVTVEADHEGRFTLGLQTLPARLRVTATGFRSQPVEVPAASANPREPRPARPLDLRLEWGQQVRGVLVGPEVANLEPVRLLLERAVGEAAWQNSEQRLEVAEDGSFEADLPHPGEYQLRLLAPGLTSAPLPRISALPGVAVDLGAILFTRGAGVHCRVVDEASGEPLAGVELRLVPRGGALYQQLASGRGWSAVTDRAGEVTAWGVTPGAYRLRARRAGYASAGVVVEVTRDELADCGTLRLGAGVPVEGRVATRDGRPYGGARVRFFELPTGTQEPVGETAAGPDGRFRGLVLPAGRYSVSVDGARRLLTQHVEVDRPAAGEAAQLELTVPVVQLVGELHRHGAPVEGGGWVTLRSELDPADHRLKVQLEAGGSNTGERQMLGTPDKVVNAAVDAAGAFEFADAPAGPVQLEFVAADGTAVQRRLVIPDRARVDVTVELGGGVLRGRVEDEHTGAGLPATLELVGSDGGAASGRVQRTLVSGPDGLFEAADLEPGVYRLRVSAEDYQPAVFDQVEVPAAGEWGEPLRVPLREGTTGTVHAEVTRGDGTPAAGLELHLLDRSGLLVQGQLLDGTGRADFARLPPGAYFAAWADPLAGAGALGPVTVAAGEPTDLRRRLDLGSTLVLSCDPEICGDRVLEGLDLRAELGSGAEAGVEVAPYLEIAAPALRFPADGQLPLGRLAPGRYFLRTVVAGRVFERPLRVLPGLAAEVELTPSRAVVSP